MSQRESGAPSPLGHRDDSELIVESIKGDDSAYGVLMERYTPLLRAYVRWRARSPSDAEDILQETWISIYTDLVKLSNTAKPGPWMLTIAQRRLADFYRSSARTTFSQISRTSDPTDVDFHEAQEKRPGPSQRLETRGKRLAIDEAMSALPERLRLAVFLRLWEGLSFKDISELLGIKESAVKMRTQRGLKKLRKHLTKSGYKSSVSGTETGL